MGFVVWSMLFAGCAETPVSSEAEEPVPAEPVVDTSIAGPRPASWVEPRVEAAKARLLESEGGEMLWRAIDAHGGLEGFLSAGTMAFDFDYAPVDAPQKRRWTRSEVDLWTRKAVQTELGEAADATLGWNGETAWVRPDEDAFPSDPRFWATTPFYFAAIPWVLADEGAHAEKRPPVVVAGTGIEDPLPTVKITYGEGVGDAPDDFYVLHLHPTDHHVVAVRYIVSYPDYFPDGGHSPEKLLVWSDHERVDGLLVATRYSSHLWNDGEPGPKTTDVRLANITFGEPIPMARFDPPPQEPAEP